MCVSEIYSEDGKKIYDRQTDGFFEAFYLPPGTYEIAYEYKPHKLPRVGRRDKVTLMAGHTYRVEVKSRYGPKRYGTKIWIEERKSGQPIAGEKW